MRHSEGMHNINVAGCPMCADRKREDKPDCPYGPATAKMCTPRRAADCQQSDKCGNDTLYSAYNATVKVVLAVQKKHVMPIYGCTSGGRGIIGFKHINGTEVRPVLCFEVIRPDMNPHDEPQVSHPNISVAAIINREIMLLVDDEPSFMLAPPKKG